MNDVTNHNLITECRSIIYFLKQHKPQSNKRDAYRNFLLSELFHKLNDLDKQERSNLLYETSAALLNFEKSGIFPKLELFQSDQENSVKNDTSSSISKCEILLLAIIPQELRALLMVFGRLNDRPDEVYKGYYLWYCEIEIPDQSNKSVAISAIGEPGNISCAYVTQALAEHCKPQQIGLVGIGAGVKDKTNVVDVVFANSVHYYEMKRRETYIPIPIFGRLGTFFVTEKVRPIQPGQNSKMISALTLFQTQKMHKEANYLFKRIGKSYSVNVDFNPAFHPGTIACGEKLLADGSLNYMRKKHDDKIRAGDMESYGFVNTCIQHNINWFVMRGISDTGDKNKSNNDKYHMPASLVAACFAKMFLTAI